MWFNIEQNPPHFNHFFITTTYTYIYLLIMYLQIHVAEILTVSISDTMTAIENATHVCIFYIHYGILINGNHFIL